MEKIQKIKAYIQDPANANFVYTSLALVITGVFAVAIFYFASQGSTEPTIEEEERERRVLSEIIRNNPKSLLPDAEDTSNEDGSTFSFVNNNDPVEDVIDSKTGNTVKVDNSNPINNSPIPAPQTGTNGEYLELQPIDLIAPDLSQYNYRETTSVTVHGPGMEKCNELFQGGCGGYYVTPTYDIAEDEEIVMKNFEYFDRTHSYYRSDITIGDQNARTDIGLYGVDVNTNLQSAYGEVYLKNIANPYEWFSNDYRFEPVSNPVGTPQSFPISYPSSYTLEEYQIRQYFGPDVEISDEFEVEGQSILELTTNLRAYCDDGLIDIIIIYEVDAETYEILKRTEYIGSISEENLRLTQTISTERKSVSLSGVKETFGESSLNGTAVVVDRRDYNYDPVKRFNQVNTHMRNNGIPFAQIDSNDELYSIYGARFPSYLENENVYQERRYYSDTEIGQKMYDLIEESLNDRPIYSMGWSDSGNGDSYYISMYDSNFHSANELAPKESYDMYGFTNINNVDVKYRTFGSAVAVVEALRSESYYYTNYPTSYPVSFTIPRAESYPSSFPSSYSENYRYLSNYSYEYFFGVPSYIVQVSLFNNDKELDEVFELVSIRTSYVYNKLREAF